VHFYEDVHGGEQLITPLQGVVLETQRRIMKIGFMLTTKHASISGRTMTTAIATSCWNAAQISK
jgi:hypothetical protein